MENNFNYGQVPKNYLHCQNTQCQHSASCLRFLVALRIDSSVSSFSIVNPAYVAGRTECPYFKPDQLIRFASGITYLFDNLPHAKAIKVKKIIYSHFGKNTYYRFRNQERLIKPEEQDFIHEVFVKEGIEEEPLFDKYVDKHDW